MIEYTLIEGVQLAMITMLLVLILLSIMAVMVSLFKYLPQQKSTAQVQLKEKVVTYQQDDNEAAHVAYIMASIVARKNSGKDVIVKSIKRV